jgi:hypothetical protein
MYWTLQAVGVTWLLLAIQCVCTISRIAVVTQHNLRREERDSDTPYQVGNGNFAFNVDVTGLQTIKPFNTLSSWGWHSSPPPPKVAIQKRKDWRQQIKILVQDCWWLHEKVWDVNRTPHENPLEQKPHKEPDVIPKPIEPPPLLKGPEKISYEEWQKRNPHRMNLARIGLLWNGKDIIASMINGTQQNLDLAAGIITSQFYIANEVVTIETLASPSIDAVGIRVQSDAMRTGNLTVFIDFTYPSPDQQSETEFLGDFRRPGNHNTSFTTWGRRIEVKHELDDTAYYVNMQWESGAPEANFQRVSPYAHRYFFNTTNTFSTSSEYVFHFGKETPAFTPGFATLKQDSIQWWQNYWNRGAFIDCTATKDPRAKELQRRIILSQYYLAINTGGSDFTADSGLVNNALYGKTQPELAWWHFAHWERWDKWDRVGSVIPYLYKEALPGAIQKAHSLGYTGARWNKMDDEVTGTTHSAINPMSVWQQPHPFYFAELEYQAASTNQTLDKWHNVLEQTASFMLSFAKFNNATKQYDLPAPIYSMDMVGMNKHDDRVKNPIFELAYWRFGLKVMAKWYQRQGLPVPANITKVYDGLVQFPTEAKDGTYIHHEGKTNMWSNSTSVSSHPTFAGLFGMLPPDPRLNMTRFQHTMAIAYSGWRITSNHTWDFPMLAMTAVRSGDSSRAVDLLLHDTFKFNKAGMPIVNGSSTPHFSSAGGLLMTVAMLANGWTELHGRHWPKDWVCESEGFNPGL